MGNIDSLPVISQVKSLVQVITNDPDGARKTQEEFIRTGIMASQVNALSQQILGNHEEAKRITEEFYANVKRTAEQLPVIGVVIGSAHVLSGDTEKGEEIIRGATRNTVVAATATVAGILCGPGAPACAAVAGGVTTVAANNMYDLVDTGIQEKIVGNTREWQDLFSGKLDGGEAYDVIMGQTLDSVHPMRPPNRRYTRSIDEMSNFEMGQSDLPNDLLPLLPSSFGDLSFNNSATSMVDTVLSVFLVTQLMKIFHPRSKPFFQEICFSSYPGLPFDDCLILVSKSLHKFDGLNDANFDDTNEFIDMDNQTATNAIFFTGLLETVELELKSLTDGNLLGYMIESATCNYSDENIPCQDLFKALRFGLKSIKDFISHARKKESHMYTEGQKGGRAVTKTVAKIKTNYWNKKKFTATDFRTDVSKKLGGGSSIKKGIQVDHKVQLQLVAKAATDVGIKFKPDFDFIKKTFNDNPNLQLLHENVNGPKGAAWKAGTATKAYAKDVLAGLDDVMHDPTVLNKYNTNAVFKGFIRQLEKLASEPLGPGYTKKW